MLREVSVDNEMPNSVPPSSAISTVGLNRMGICTFEVACSFG
jgi:hypothetical protein